MDSTPDGRGPKRPNEESAKLVPIQGMGVSTTGAAIPARFERQLRGTAMRRRGNEANWVAVAKVHGLTGIRQTYGDVVAEELLREVSGVLRSSLREADKLSPIGREEYGIILAAPGGEEATAVLRRLVREVQAAAKHDSRWRAATLSAGLAPLWTQEPGEIIDSARRALARAEQRGGGLVMMSTAAGARAPG